jgi:dipeptidyl aminopeptidase/acylaminoacyl peptidase
VQEAAGKKAPARTYQDLLRNPADERKFEHYATTEVRRFTLDGKSESVLPAGIYRSLRPSPGAAYLLVEQVHRPFSYQFPLDRFPYRAFVADRAGKTLAELADKPLADTIPIAFDAAEAGRRDFQWRDDAPATVVWIEAQDGGDPAKDVPKRDLVYQLAAPFAGTPGALCATRNRLQDITWGEGGIAIVSDFRWKDRNVRTYLVLTGQDNPDPRVLFEYSREDLYGRPGEFVTVPSVSGRDVLLASKDRSRLYLVGEGYSPEGNRPFLDELEVASGKATRLWRADGIKTYEQIVRVLDPQKKLALTRIQGTKEYPNLYLRKMGTTEAPKQITYVANPFKALEGMTTKKIHYKRDDGVDLTADLHLPPGYDPVRDGRLPMLMEAYPTEFKDKKAAGMVDSSPHEFVTPSWGSPVFWALRGYAVLQNAQFPIVGEGKAEPNDTYIEQLVADARAAIKAVDDLGVVDPKRVAVMGHSYGAFMTANLLAHSDLFAAGIARSGAYNRSLTPFGFQSEERSYWDAQQVYERMSPFNYADKIKTPMLLIHGEADNNPGTFTLQSERLFQAVKGLGGRARLVLLPYESHGYAAKENIFHMLWEMDTWLETYVKGRAPERAAAAGASTGSR